MTYEIKLSNSDSMELREAGITLFLYKDGKSYATTIPESFFSGDVSALKKGLATLQSEIRRVGEI